MATDGTGTIENVPAVPAINRAICSGCGRCVAACPIKIITLETAQFRKYALILHPVQCSSCGQCVTACPISAMTGNHPDS